MMEKLSDRFNLNGKQALVTGSSQGIGKSVALGLAEYGADVMVHYKQDRKKADETVEQIKGHGVKTGSVSADLAEKKSLNTIKEATIKSIGEPDILILNASVQMRKNWEHVSETEFRKQIDVNFGSALWLIQMFTPAMKAQQWGRIITIGSVQQYRPHPDMIVYSATKMALLNMVKSLAPELGEKGITINNLAPGAISTGRNKKVLSNEEYRNKVLSKIPIGRIGEPIDCAGLALLLSSEAGRYITGADLLVDGGMSLPF